MSQVYDVIVIGAGIVGSCTAYHCQRLGLKALQIEQYNLGHSHGSSHGMSRITRLVHVHEPYIPIVRESFRQIADFEEKRGEKLWRNTGLVWLGDHKTIDRLADNVKKSGLAHEVLSAKEVNDRYPQLVYDDHWKAIYDPMGGMIYSEKWLNAYQEEYRLLGGEVHENETFKEVTEDGDLVTVHTSKGIYKTKKTIICAGPWLQTLIPEIAHLTKLQLLRIYVAYWKPKDEKDLPLFQEDKMPVVITQDGTTGEDGFALPIRDYPDAIKCCKYYGAPYNLGDEEKEAEASNLEQPRTHLSAHFPLIDSTRPVRVDKCTYTMSSDKHYVFDWHPKLKNVLIGGCMSGSGFKVSPALGRALAHLAAGKESPFDLSMFSLKRFISETV